MNLINLIYLLAVSSAPLGQCLQYDSILLANQNSICDNRARNVSVSGLNKSPSSTPAVSRDHEVDSKPQDDLYEGVQINKFDIMVQQYIDEYNDRFENVLNLDESIDERLANIVHAIYSKGVMNLDYFRFNSGDRQVDAERQTLVEGQGIVDDVKCGQHLNEMLSQLKELESMLERERKSENDGQTRGQSEQIEYNLGLKESHIRLTRALDAFGRYDSGFMSGKTHSFGSYEQCSNTKLEFIENGRAVLAGTRFCWAKFDLHRHLDQSFASSKRHYPLSVGICLPESCHTRSFNKHAKQIQTLVDSQFKLPKSMFVKQNLQIESIFCTVDSSSQMNIPTNGKVLLWLLCSWFALTLLATIHASHIKRMEEGTLRTLLTCLDLKTSWLDFVGSGSQQAAETTTTTKLRRRVDLDTLNPVRWAGCAFVIYGHAMLVNIGHSMDQLKMPSQVEATPFGGFVVVGTVVVDTFFVMTGLIMSYLVMKKANKVKPAIRQETQTTQTPDNQTAKRRSAGSWMFLWHSYQIIKTRYLRLFPMLMLVYWFKRSVFIYLGSGPFWDFGFNKETYYGACHAESWLVPFTFTSAFLPLSKQCLMQSWSVSSDMFFVLVFTPVMLIMTKKPKLAALLALLYCLASNQALLRAIAALDPMDNYVVSDLTSIGMGYLFSRVSHLYSYPIYRVTAFAVGMFAGYALYWYDQQESRQWPKWLRGPATMFSVIFIPSLFLLLSNASVVKPLVKPYHRILFPYFMTLGKVVWALANSIVFLRMITDWNGSIWMRANASKFWRTMSKLNYALLLLHFDLLIYDSSATPQATLNSFWAVFETFTTTYLLCILLSIIVYVVYESPMDKLIRSFSLPQTKSNITTNHVPTSESPIKSQSSEDCIKSKLKLI